MTILETIMEVVARRQENVFLIDAATGRKISYGEFHLQACALAAQLRDRGLKKGDRIGIMVPNCCELAILYFACIYLGSVIVPVSPAHSKSDVQFILSNCKPAIVVASASCLRTIKNIHPNVLTLVTTQDGPEELPGEAISTDAPSGTRGFKPLETATADDLVAIMYTSGTSAKPKGLAHKLGRMFRNASAFAKMQGIDQDSRFYLTLSMAYMGGLYNLLVLPLLCGASVVIDHVFDARSSLQFWEQAKKNEVNALWMAPTVLSILLRMDRGRIGEEFCRSSVRHAFVGFAPLPRKVKEQFESRYGVYLIENYGLSETLFVTARSRDVVNCNGYVGEPLPGVNLRTIAESGDPVTPGETGELQIQTPDLMAGYLDGDGKLIESDASSWFSTGDIGRIDEGSSVFVIGRKKDLIIRGGVNISPAAIEEALMRVEGVVEVAVVSIPHELYGEDVLAVLKLESGLELESVLDSVIAYAKRTLAPPQQPARYITMDEFPRTANGKVQKVRIRELVAEKLQLSFGPSLKPSSTESSVASR